MYMSLHVASIPSRYPLARFTMMRVLTTSAGLPMAVCSEHTFRCGRGQTLDDDCMLQLSMMSQGSGARHAYIAPWQCWVT